MYYTRQTLVSMGLLRIYYTALGTSTETFLSVGLTSIGGRDYNRPRFPAADLDLFLFHGGAFCHSSS